MPNKWRIGILGLGHWYSAYGLARGLAESGRAELIAVGCPDPEKAGEFAGTFGVQAFASYEELLARAEVDAVHICPPVAEIPACTIAAAQAGKHMVLGKPMAMTLEQADEMVKVVKRSGVKCLPFQAMYRTRSAGLKKRIDGGLIGDIVVMHSTGRWSIAEDWLRSGKAGWFADPKQVPGGALIDEGIYGVDQLRWLAGAPVVEVSAKTANLVHKDIGVEDWGMATFTYANGVVATLEAGWTINSPKKTGPSPKQNATLRTEIVGTRGEIVQDSHLGGLAILAAGAPGWVIERPSDEPYTPPGLGAMGQLLDCLDAGTDPAAGIEDAREGFVIAMAAYQSARERRPVRLDR